MICNECINKEICTVFANMKQYLTFAEIDIKTCYYYRNTNSNNAVNDISNINNQIKSINFKERNLDLINELSDKNRIKKEEELKKNIEVAPKIREIKAIPLKMDYVCPGCGATTFSDDGSKCDLCGKDICSCCATVDSDTGNLLCPECWNE